MSVESYTDIQKNSKEEHLSIERLKLFNTTKLNIDIDSRPKESFIDLMNWVVNNFSIFLNDKNNLQKIVHNRIVIDGKFLQYCEENKITIRCLFKDSIISWGDESSFEKFFVQGVFLIKTKNVEFLHAALFHKGNQQEDEVSFFIVASENNYEKYIELRNSFERWLQSRDRDNLYIRVIDGEDIPYTKDHSWDDLFFQQDIKTDIKNLVENFLSSKDFYVKNKIPWKRGILLYGPPGNGKTSLIKTIIANYDFKPITILAEANNESVRQAFSYAEEQSPSLLYFEDLDSLLEKNVDTSSFLNLMDGISAKNGLLVVATANNIQKLKNSITDRPSRFDRKFEIKLPTAEMAYIYLRKWFGSLLSVAKCKELSKYAEKHKFSYAYLKELYISTMFEALASNRKLPTEKDVQKALNRLIQDKRLLNGDAVNIEKYFKQG